GVRAGKGVRHFAAPESPPSVRYDSEIGCKTPCSPRASVRDRSGSKTKSDPDIRAGWFRSPPIVAVKLLSRKTKRDNSWKWLPPTRYLVLVPKRKVVKVTKSRNRR